MFQQKQQKATKLKKKSQFDCIEITKTKQFDDFEFKFWKNPTCGTKLLATLRLLAQHALRLSVTWNTNNDTNLQNKKKLRK